MTDKATTGPLFRKLNELAPYPPAEYAKAAEVVRWLGAQGLLSDARAQSGNDQFPPGPDHAHLVGAQLAAAFFLEGMTQLAEMMTDPVAGRTVAAAADIMAAQVVGAWNGGDFGNVLWNLLGDDAAAISAVTKDLAAAIAAPAAEVDHA